jgi:hypothetical protein
LKSEIDEFINLIKKSLGKKRSSKLTKSDISTLTNLKKTELSLKSLGAKEKNYRMSVDALGSYISNISERKSKSGGSRFRSLKRIYGLVFAPANTAAQILGSGGPEGGKEKKSTQTGNYSKKR